MCCRRCVTSWTSREAAPEACLRAIPAPPTPFNPFPTCHPQIAVASIVLRAMPEYCSSLAADGVQQGQWAWLARTQGWLSTVVMAGTSGRWAAVYSSLHLGDCLLGLHVQLWIWAATGCVLVPGVLVSTACGRRLRYAASARTTSALVCSRGGQSFDDVPCAVLLSHLVVVFEVGFNVGPGILGCWVGCGPLAAGASVCCQSLCCRHCLPPP